MLAPSRIAAQLVSGIGFLGAGALEEAYRSRNQSCQLRVEADNGSLTPEVLPRRSSSEPARSSASWWSAKTWKAPMSF
jgi:hypothetical protein